ncbi:hypothetical protein B0H12DRAFT_222157 [Mycena haematopus]|nr:hypothetical protein B0H12DRAFT_222157 [Mycena haematopus]
MSSKPHTLPGRPVSNFTVVQVDSGRNDQTLENAALEADLDMRTVALAGSVSATFFSAKKYIWIDGVDGFIHRISSPQSSQVLMNRGIVRLRYDLKEQDLLFSLVNEMCST